MCHACKLGLRRHRLEAPRLPVCLRPVAALGQEQESKAPGGETRSRGGLGSLLGPSARSRVLPGSISQWRVTQQAAISRPNSFPSRPRGPSWTSRRPTRSGQSRPPRRFPPSMRAFASPLRRVELVDSGLHFFSPPRCEVVHGCAKFFEARAEDGIRLSPPATFRDKKRASRS